MFSQYRNFERGEHIVVGVDAGFGGLDRTCAQFISKRAYDVPLVYFSHKDITELTPRLKEQLEAIYNATRVKPTVAYEINSGADIELKQLDKLNRDGKYEIFKMPIMGKKEEGETDQLGFRVTSANRPKILNDLRDAFENELIKIYHRLTLEEMASFVIKETQQGWRAEHEQGKHDDTIFALALANFLYNTVPTKTIIPSTRYVRIEDEDDLGFSNKFEIKRKWWWQEQEHKNYKKYEL